MWLACSGGWQDVTSFNISSSGTWYPVAVKTKVLDIKLKKKKKGNKNNVIAEIVIQ